MNIYCKYHIQQVALRICPLAFSGQCATLQKFVNSSRVESKCESEGGILLVKFLVTSQLLPPRISLQLQFENYNQRLGIAVCGVISRHLPDTGEPTLLHPAPGPGPHGAGLWGRQVCTFPSLKSKAVNGISEPNTQ